MGQSSWVRRAIRITKGAFSTWGYLFQNSICRVCCRDLYIGAKLGESWLVAMSVSFETSLDLKASLNLIVFLFFPGIRVPLEVYYVYPNMGNFS